MTFFSITQDKKELIWATLAVLTLFVLVTLPLVSFARAGGGGSDSGGSGSYSDGSSFSGASNGGAGGESSPAIFFGFVGILFVFALVLISIARRRQKKARAKLENEIETAGLIDTIWNEVDLIKHVEEVFPKFQSDWSNFNVDSMKAYLSESYWKRMVLELSVLKNENRQNIMEDARLVGLSHLPSQDPLSYASVVIIKVDDELDNTKDNFTAQINGVARDVLFDTETKKELSVDSSTFTEYWDFIRDGNVWKLNLIRQMTEDSSMREPEIEDFAKRNNFFYDPDFGWLMMPNKGVIFSQSNFKTSDINNHVVGYYRNKIVEFYTFVPLPNSTNYIVAQVALPLKYNDILVKKKNRFLNSDPRGLRRIKTESNDFDEKFCLWAHPEDQVSSFELLTPNFMEKIYGLPFELNIEVVGSFLYFYAESREDVDYDKMLEILSWAFDEMKM